MHLRKNLVNIQLSNDGNTTSQEHETYDIDRHIDSFTLFNTVDDYANVVNTLLDVKFKHSTKEKIHVSTQEVMSVIQQLRVKEEFSYISIISEFGGQAFLLWMLGSFLISPISRFLFYLSAVSSMYLARTREDHLFRKTPNGYDDSKFEREKDQDS